MWSYRGYYCLCSGITDDGGLIVDADIAWIDIFHMEEVKEKGDLSTLQH